jgi:hypothetical protein
LKHVRYHWLLAEGHITQGYFILTAYFGESRRCRSRMGSRPEETAKRALRSNAVGTNVSGQVITAPAAGRLIDADKVGTSIHQGGLIAKIQDAQHTTEVRSPISGRIRTLSAITGANVAAGAEIASVDPAAEQVWEALRALYLVGQLDDLPAVQTYERELPEIPDRLRQQAALTEKSILSRAGK